MADIALPAGNLNASPRARWSNYEAPKPATVMNVTTEDEVAATVWRLPGIEASDPDGVQVKYCTHNCRTFLVQNGGSGWAKTTGLGERGVLVNLSGLNAVTFSADKKQATIGGGATVKNAVDAAHAAGAILLTGGCNVVGMVGAYLGGGYGTSTRSAV